MFFLLTSTSLNHQPFFILPTHIIIIQTSCSYNQALFLLLLAGDLHLVPRGVVEVVHEDGLFVELQGEVVVVGHEICKQLLHGVVVELY